MTDLNILCMKWGTAYNADDVNRLYGMVKRHLHRDFRFICFTDDATGFRKEVEVKPLPALDIPPPHGRSPWRKLSMFQPQLEGLKGLGLFLDLDLVIVQDIDDFITFGRPEDFCIIENWTQRGQGIGNSSVYRFMIGQYGFIYEAYIRSPQAVCEAYDNEQMFLSRQIVKQGRSLVFWPEHWCRSFQRHCIPFFSWFKTPRIPKGTKIVVFHGSPKPSDAIAGKWPQKTRLKFWRRIRPTPWVKEHWKA